MGYVSNPRHCAAIQTYSMIASVIEFFIEQLKKTILTLTLDIDQNKIFESQTVVVLLNESVLLNKWAE